MEVPVQFFQSIIAIEVAIAGALLFQVRYFDSRGTDVDAAGLPDPRWRLVVAVILGATIFGSLDGIAHGGGRQMAAFVTLGVALSVLPILIRVLPPLGPGCPSGQQAVVFGGHDHWHGAVCPGSDGAALSWSADDMQRSIRAALTFG